MIDLKLDTNAMNELFPEGSALRLNLQNAVMANFVRKNADVWMSTEVHNIIHQIAKEEMRLEDHYPRMFKKELEKYFRLQFPTMEASELTLKSRQLIEEHVSKAVHLQMADMVDQAIKNISIEQVQLMINERIDKNIEGYINASVDHRVKAILNTAMNSTKG